MKIISKISDSTKKIDLYFGIDEGDIDMPFIFGGCSNDPCLPSIAQWSASSRFGLSNLENISGSQWRDWRTTLKKLDCEWVISVIEAAKEKNDISAAVTEIIRRYSNIENS